jgi:hypothetical protein
MKLRRVQVLILACVSNLRPTVGFAPTSSLLRVCRGRQHGLPLGLEITCRGAEQERPHTLADSGVSTAMGNHAQAPLPAVGPVILLLLMVLRAMMLLCLGLCAEGRTRARRPATRNKGGQRGPPDRRIQHRSPRQVRNSWHIAASLERWARARAVLCCIFVDQDQKR